MKKSSTKWYIFLMLIAFVMFFSPNIVKAESYSRYNISSTPSKNSKYSSYDYVIDSYNVDISVNENNTFDITEIITAYFNVPKHGIYRTIPSKNKVTRLDGTTSTNRARLTNAKTSDQSIIRRENGNYTIQLGSASSTITGEKKYIIEYTYNIGKDPIKNADELYFNIIGTNWDTVIGNVTFKITMPKEFDSSKLGFSSGLMGLTNNSEIDYMVDGNKIMGRYNGILNAGEAITVRCELPEGYFDNTGLPLNPYSYIMFIIPILCLIISFFMWYKFGRDKNVVETVEFYPPQGFNSLEIGFLYKGKANNQDVTSLLVYLANKGYIKIIETDKSLLSSDKDFKITKLKEYDGDNIYEKLFLEGLFKKKDTVTKSDLYNKFYITMDKILKNINDKKNKNKIFEKSSFNKSFVLILSMIISSLTIIITPMLNSTDFEDLLLTLGMCLFYVPFYAIGISSAMDLFNIIWLGFTVIHSAFFLSVSPLAEALLFEKIYLFGFIIGILCIIGMIIFFKLMPKRTQYGNEILGKIKGFKNFLETTEKENLDDMVMKNPTYFYDILPFTYVLGISDKWIKKFESISLQAPDWYDGSTSFDINHFGGFMDSTMSSTRSAMSSSPSSSSGGGSSGGGSSGGGSGGGGGGSW